jgi:diacylglycerol kinase (ATP)
VKTAIIVNSKSGRGRAEEIYQKNKLRLETKFGSCEVLETLPLKDNSVLVRLLSDGCKTFVVIGGDGTLHRLINLLAPLIEPGKKFAHLAPVEIGIISAGTGRDFVRNLPEGEIVPTDIGETTHSNGDVTYFINSLSIGIGGEAIYHMRDWHKKLLPSKLSYLIPGLKAYMTYRPDVLSLRADGNEIPIKKNLGIMICNGQFSGGGMQWSKKASLNDRKFHLVVLPQIQLPHLIPSLYRLLKNNLNRITGYFEVETTHVQIASPNGEEIKIEMDGDLFFDKAIEVKIRSGLFKVIKMH